GKWVNGTEGNGLLRLADPVTLPDGTLVREIPFRNGMPIFDKWATGGVMIAMTGNQAFDQAEARRMWQELNPGKPIGEEFLFHHDGQVVELGKYKGKQVFGGRMQLVPLKL